MILRADTASLQQSVVVQPDVSVLKVLKVKSDVKTKQSVAAQFGVEFHNVK